MQKISITCLVLLSLVLVGCGKPENPSGPAEDPRIVTCTEDAKVCPDGTVVTRGGLACEFAACPGENATDVTTSESGQ